MRDKEIRLQLIMGLVPLSKILDYGEEKTAEKRKLEEEIEKLKAEI